jgi:hypothetical protein
MDYSSSRCLMNNLNKVNILASTSANFRFLTAS